MSAIIKLFRPRAGKAREERSPDPQQRFEHLLRPHIELLYRMAYRWTGTQADAEDLVQELLVRLTTRIDEMEALESLRPWLLRILYNRYVDDYRRQRRSPIDASHGGWEPDQENEDAAAGDLIASAEDPHNPAEQEDLRRSLHNALAQLEPDQRDAVLLHDMEGYSAEETAGILEIPLGTVKSRLHRARARLRLLLFDENDLE